MKLTVVKIRMDTPGVYVERRSGVYMPNA